MEHFPDSSAPEKQATLAFSLKKASIAFAGTFPA
jgi:hypothetical protein